jgi:hypothetical protein
MAPQAPLTQSHQQNLLGWRRQRTACVPSVARKTIFNGTLSELKYNDYDLIKN